MFSLYLVYLVIYIWCTLYLFYDLYLVYLVTLSSLYLAPCSSGCDVNISACEEGPGICTHLLTIASMMLIMVTFPLSLLFTVKVVQEYERAVIFRLGRLLSGGASGPGVFFVIPCMDIYVKIDMRTATYEIPPQEV